MYKTSKQQFIYLSLNTICPNQEIWIYDVHAYSIQLNSTAKNFRLFFVVPERFTSTKDFKFLFCNFSSENFLNEQPKVRSNRALFQRDQSFTAGNFFSLSRGFLQISAVPSFGNEVTPKIAEFLDNGLVTYSDLMSKSSRDIFVVTSFFFFFFFFVTSW